MRPFPIVATFIAVALATPVNELALDALRLQSPLASDKGVQSLDAVWGNPTNGEFDSDKDVDHKKVDDLNAALKEGLAIAWTTGDSKPTPAEGKEYFGTEDENLLKEVQNVFQLLRGSERDYGSPSLRNFKWQKQDRYKLCAQPDYLLYMHQPYEETGIPGEIVPCGIYFLRNFLLASKLPCETIGEAPSVRWMSSTGGVLHELLHANFVGNEIFKTRIVDIKDSYGPKLIRQLAKSKDVIAGRPAAMLNADNYQLFATEKFIRKRCGFKEVPPAEDASISFQDHSATSQEL